MVANISAGPREVTKRYIESNFKDENYLMLVAQKDENIIGFSTVVYEGWNNAAWIEWMIVHKSYRGKGIGSKMIKKSIVFSKEKKARKLFVDTGIKDRKAIKFYKKNGFKKHGNIKDYYIDGDDAIVLGLDLISV